MALDNFGKALIVVQVAATTAAGTDEDRGDL